MGLAFPATTISKAGPHAVMLVHGLHSAPIEMRYVARVLHKAQFTTVCPAVAGYSMGSDCSTWEMWVDALVEQFDELAAQYRSVSLVGLSIGASLCLAVAQRRPGVAAVIALSATLRYDGWSMPWYSFLLEPCHLLGIARGYRYKEAEPYGLKNEALRQKVASAMKTSQQSVIGPSELPIEFLYHARQLGRHVTRHLRKITSDALVIHAVDDETASPLNAWTVFHNVSSPHKRKIMLGDSYHIICMDNERELVARETTRFIISSLQRQNLLPTDSRLPNTSRALTRLARKSNP
jgi:carboxylesterase